MTTYIYHDKNLIIMYFILLVCFYTKSQNFHEKNIRSNSLKYNWIKSPPVVVAWWQEKGLFRAFTFIRFQIRAVTCAESSIWQEQLLRSRGMFFVIPSVQLVGSSQYHWDRCEDTTDPLFTYSS